MRMFVFAGLALWIAVISPAFPTEASHLILDTGSRGLVGLPEMMEGVKGARIVFVGESHDDARHHEAQLRVIRAMAETGFPLAIGLEMFRAEDQALLDEWVAGRMDDERFAALFDGTWGAGSWALYGDIFRHARKRGIRLVALNLDRRIVHQVAREGSGSVDRVANPGVPEVACDPPDRYRDYIRRVMAGHRRDRKDFVRFCQAQMLWDAAMASNLIRFLDSNPSHAIVVLAGSTHSWKHGIPERVRQWSSLPFKVILPSGGAGAPADDVRQEDADYVWLFEAS